MSATVPYAHRRHLLVQAVTGLDELLDAAGGPRQKDLLRELGLSET